MGAQLCHLRKTGKELPASAGHSSLGSRRRSCPAVDCRGARLVPPRDTDVETGWEPPKLKQAQPWRDPRACSCHAEGPGPWNHMQCWCLQAVCYWGRGLGFCQ